MQHCLAKYPTAKIVAGFFQISLVPERFWHGISQIHLVNFPNPAISYIPNLLARKSFSNECYSTPKQVGSKERPQQIFRGIHSGLFWGGD
jgi:hypothetical protein